jgi:hypothetical protein
MNAIATNPKKPANQLHRKGQAMPFPLLSQPSNYADALAHKVLELAKAAGRESEMHCRSALPSPEELEAEFGRDLLQQGRHMVGSHNVAVFLGLKAGQAVAAKQSYRGAQGARP